MTAPPARGIGRTTTSARPGSPWVTITRPRPDARVRLVCLPFAGGGASAYREWPDHLPDDVEVVAIQSPGREERLCEPPIDSMETLAEGVVDGLSGHLDRPVALFGHSMGALVAFEVARLLRRAGPGPVHLFASGHKAPHVRVKRSPNRHALPDREFVAAVGDLNGIPTEIRENAEFMEMVLPTLRSDFRLAETYAFRPLEPLRCPISAFGGLGDRDVYQEDLDVWSCHTTGRFRLHMLAGDHFFVDSSRNSLLRLIRDSLR